MWHGEKEFPFDSAASAAIRRCLAAVPTASASYESRLVGYPATPSDDGNFRRGLDGENVHDWDQCWRNTPLLRGSRRPIRRRDPFANDRFAVRESAVSA
jgi:hypothetical protein